MGVINENCPACFEEPKERDRVKELLKQEEAMVPALFFNLKKAFLPLLADEAYESMDKVVKDIEYRQNAEKIRYSTKQHDVTIDGSGSGSSNGHNSGLAVKRAKREREIEQ